jgi:uncharacterized protein YdhG (YjbR/CyaY superfamily)
VATVVPQAVQAYIDEIPAEHRPLFDRLHRLILQARPDAEVTFSYKMPTYRAGKRRLHVAAWRHGISVYGSQHDRDGGFTARHPQLVTSKGTIQLRAASAAGIGDEEFVSLARSALAP